MKFKDFQAPVLFSSTFKALNLGKKIQVLSRMRGNLIIHLFSVTFANTTINILPQKVSVYLQPILPNAPPGKRYRIR